MFCNPNLNDAHQTVRKISVYFSPRGLQLRHFVIQVEWIEKLRMSGRFYALCLAGMLGSLFVGYCIYFDRKRRSDPDYKKKVLASEENYCAVIKNI